MSWIVKAGKQGKKIVKKLIMPAEKHYVGFTRRDVYAAFRMERL